MFYEQAVALAKVHQVSEAVFDASYEERIYNSGLPLYYLPTSGWLLRLGRIGRLAARALALRRLVAACQFDVVISHMDGANWVNVLSGSAARKILIVHGTVLHDQNISVLLQWVRRTVIFPRLYNRADRTVAVSKGIEKELNAECGVHNATTVLNSFDVRAIELAAAAPIEPNHQFIFDHPLVLVVAARLEVQKNLESLLYVLSELRAHGRAARLVVLGDGSLRFRLLQRARDLKLRVFDKWGCDPSMIAQDYDAWFLGFVANPFAYIARGTVFVFPSAWEGFPLALCEAMICGVPVVSADCPTGPREILTAGDPVGSLPNSTYELSANGILAPVPRDAATISVWTSAILRLANDDVLRDTFSASARVAACEFDRYEWERRWLELVREVMEQDGTVTYTD